MSGTSDIKAIAERNGFSEEAARALADAIRSGGGSMAQFSHPELGGMGQWSRGGMLMIGSMNDHDLKARVGRLAEDLASRGDSSGRDAGPSERSAPPTSDSPWAQTGDLNDNRPSGGQCGGQTGGQTGQRHGSGAWWPDGLGQPSSSGAQNGVRYAAFPEARRLAIEEGGKVTVYDTGDHRISGVSQSQSGSGPGSLRFTSQKGEIDLGSLTRA
ncbi:hypothetical protein [Aureimonas ureilytica]|uniref:hypothetical protein n=1 Tax=Aureimonas ureilytica TaxID=401562 RepID=UPI0003711651|nr:hypothetical protein [Aureimonas ureilytica]